MLRGRIYSKLPERYVDEFLEKRTHFIKSRVNLLCLLASACYIISSAIWYIIFPEEFTYFDVAIYVFLTISCSIVLYRNKKARDIWKSVFNAYLVTVILLLLVFKVDEYYQHLGGNVYSIYVFTLLFVTLVIPWTPRGVVTIGIMDVLFYIVDFHRGNFQYAIRGDVLVFRAFLEGLIFLGMAFALCYVIKKKEAEREVDNFILVKELENKNKQMDKELRWARQVHRAIIPGSMNFDNFEIAVDYLPVYYVGGDYVKYCLLDEKRITFIISDVTGHGVPAALLVNRFHGEFERNAREGLQPGSLLNELNKFIKDEFRGSEMYLSAFCGHIDLSDMSLSYSNFGHPPQYIYNTKKSGITELSSQTGLLGFPLEDNNIYEDRIDIGFSDKLFMYTDGIIETFNKRKEEFGEKRVQDFLVKSHAFPAERFNRDMLIALNTFKYQVFRDDICLMTINVKP